jgi:hypothetical protein
MLLVGGAGQDERFDEAGLHISWLHFIVYTTFTILTMNYTLTNLQ